MLRRRLGMVAALACGVASSSMGQQPGSAVQLLTVSSFGVRTTVVVPDRGSAYLGGINRAASGRNEFGVPLLKFPPFRNRGIGMERSAANMHVTAYIHDFDAMDEYLLSQPTRRNPHGLTQVATGTLDTPNFPAFSRHGPGAGPIFSQPDRLAAGRPQNRSPRAVDTPLPRWEPVASTQPALSVADLRAKHEQEQRARAQEAADFFERGKKAENAGKLNVARTYYEMAQRRAADPLKTQIAARLRLMEETRVASSR